MKRLYLITLALIVLFNSQVLAQSKQPIIWWNMTWNGLRNSQPANEMPKGKAPFQQSTLKQKQLKPAKFVKRSHNEWELTNGWELIEAYKTREASTKIFDINLDTKDWYNATVPGTVLTSLVDMGMYPDPYYGLNNLAITDTLCRMDWWYRIVFDTPVDLNDKISRLHFNGINYIAEVYINGKMLGTVNGAFIRGDFDITKHLVKNGKNVLAVRIIPPFNPGIPHEQSMISGQGLNGGQLCMDGPTFISSEGWDWVPGIRDRNIGIWQDVRITAHTAVELVDPFVITDLNLPDTTSAEITIKTDVRNLSDKPAEAEIHCSIERILNKQERDELAYAKMNHKDILPTLEDMPIFIVSKKITLQPGETLSVTLSSAEFEALKIKNPKLWWPNGYGEQNMYNISLNARVNRSTSDMKHFRFGIREMSYELMVAKDSTDFRRVEMNPLKALKSGKPVFDVVNRVKYDDKGLHLPAVAKGVDFNSVFDESEKNDPIGPYFAIKVNGVRIFAKGGNWGMDDAMKNTSRSKMEPYFKLHHGENFNIVRNWTGESTDEMFYTLADEYGMLVWNDFWMTTENSNTDPNDHNLFVANAEDAVKRFRNHPSIAVWCPRNEGFAPEELEVRLNDMCSALDPSRIYHGQSRFLNMGDSGPWGFFPDFAYYFNERAKGFNTEMGCYSIPTANTIRKFIAPEDLWPINDVWAYHDLHHTTQGFNHFMNAINKYGEPTGFEDFVKKAQMTNYDSWRAMIESWNSKMWDDCTGLVLWMSHPAWPSMIWQTYSWDYETHASYFGSKKASEPLHIQMNLNNNKVVVINASNRNAENLKATLYYYDLNGKLLHTQTAETKANINQKVECFTGKTDMKLPDLYLARVELKQGKNTISVNDYWKHSSSNTEKSNKAFNSLPEFKISASKIFKNNNAVIDLTNGKSVAVAVKLNVKNLKTGEIVLPAYFSDGYFNMLPGEKRQLTLEIPSNINLTGCAIIAEGYNGTSRVLVNL